jgi:predicted methyltransferase
MGFALTGTSELLDNPADDHTLGPFDPALGRNTDRFILRFVKL